jgi:hypothetical protein
MESVWKEATMAWFIIAFAWRDRRKQWKTSVCIAIIVA